MSPACFAIGAKSIPNPVQNRVHNLSASPPLIVTLFVSTSFSARSAPSSSAGGFSRFEIASRLRLRLVRCLGFPSDSSFRSFGA